MQADEIKNLIEKGMPETEVIVNGDGTHFTAIVISSTFTGKSRVQKQQMVYATLSEQLANGSLHALSLKTFTPEEWRTFKQDGS